MGHEIASHGYSHVLPHKVGPGLFKNGIDWTKKILEDIIHKQIRRFRVTGFGIKENIKWPFNVIREVGYKYDSSVFPAMQEQNHMFGTTYGKTCRPDIIPTEAGPLTEIPISTAKIFGLRFF